MGLIGKNKRKQFQVFDLVHNVTLTVDSQEELEFTKWLCVAKSLNLIKDFRYQPEPYLLSDPIYYETIGPKNKPKTKTLFREHIYTPDFRIFIEKSRSQNLHQEFKIKNPLYSDNEIMAYDIDVKGSFQKDAGRSFSINQKWVYTKYQVYIHKVVPKVFFAKFGIIEDFLYTEKTKKPSKRYQGFPMIQDLI